MQLFPDAGLAPFVQAIPQGHATAAHLLGKIFPWDAGLEHEEDAGETDPIRHARLAHAWNVWMFRENRFHQGPKLVGHQQFAHRVLHDDNCGNYALWARSWEW